jgi:hypothetical protein
MKASVVTGGGSLRRVATRQLDEGGLVVRTQSRISAALWAEDASRPTFILAAGLLVFALLVSIVFTAWRPSVWPGRAPDDLDGTMMSLWQVHGSVVGLGVPLLVLLIEQARSRAVIATNAGPALVSESRIVFTTVFSLGAVIEIGVVTLYVRSDSALATSFLVACGSVLLIVWAYASALSLLLSPRRLRAQSLRLLERRLRASMMEAFIEDRMNQILMTELARWIPKQLTRDDLLSGEWRRVNAQASGRVIDVELRALVALLRRFVPQGTLRAGKQPTPETPDPGTGELATQLLVRPIGDRVRTGDALLAIGGLPHEELPLDGLASLFRIERDGR